MTINYVRSTFFSVLKFWFCRLSRGWKGKKWPKMLKISVCRALYFRNHISYDLHLWYTYMYKRIISPGIFFIFFKILIFKINRGEVKGQKMAQSDKNVCQFGVFRGIKGKNDLKLPIWVCFALLSEVNHIIKILIMISAGVFRYFVFKNATL